MPVNSRGFTLRQKETFRLERIGLQLVGRAGAPRRNLIDSGCLTTMPVKTIWSENGDVFLLDQTLLPGRREVLRLSLIHI